MEALNKVLHPKQTLHKTDDETDFAGTQTPPSSGPSNPEDAMRPNQETREALNSEPNVTGTDRPAPKEEFPSHNTTEQHHQEEHPKISRGHHHPRQPVGATGLPPNHKPGQGCGGPGA